MSRRVQLAVLFVILNSSVNCLVYSQTFNTSAWLEDFAQLKQEMSAHYANLEWAVENRGLDLQELSEQTESRLRRARTNAEAQQIISSFLRAFGDGHLGVRWAANSESGSQVSGAESAMRRPSLCVQLGYQEHHTEPGIAFSRLNNFQEFKTADSKYFPTGVLRLPNNQKIGVIRIGFFSEHAFPDLCEQAASDLGLARDAPCDGCAGRLERRTADLLTAALERQITALQRARISALLVDISWNDGGTNWVEPAARTLTAKHLHAPRIGLIRHEHVARQLKSQLEDIEADQRQASPPQRKVLAQAGDVLRRALMEVQRPCARSLIWQNQRLSCSLLVTEPTLYASGILPYARPGEITETKYPESRTRLFYPSRYTYREGVYAGPLLVLVDRETASSAEYFAAMLRDNNAAIVVGEPTYGAGCGYTNGGIATVLKHSGGRVAMPDCVRFRSDGSNEVEGITPDILIPWRSNDSPYQRARRVLGVLPAALAISSVPSATALLQKIGSEL